MICRLTVVVSELKHIRERYSEGMRKRDFVIGRGLTCAQGVDMRSFLDARQSEVAQLDQGDILQMHQ
jgi:hypothetical protein